MGYRLDSDGQTAQALADYRKYLDLALAAMDAYRIKKGAEGLEKISAIGAAATSKPN